MNLSNWSQQRICLWAHDFLVTPLNAVNNSPQCLNFINGLKVCHTCMISCFLRSICLLIQAALPCMLFARGPVRLQLKGGTNASFAPQFDYFTWVSHLLLVFRLMIFSTVIIFGLCDYLCHIKISVHVNNTAPDLQLYVTRFSDFQSHCRKTWDQCQLPAC